MWQKERLLNLVFAQLPERCTKVEWLDADVLFESAAWAVDTSRALDAHPVVQPFDTAVRLSGGGCWEWASDKPALQHWAADYFSRRREDGAPASAAEQRRAAGERRHSDL